MKVLLVVFLLLLPGIVMGQEALLDTSELGFALSQPQFLIEISANNAEVLRIDKEGRIIFHYGAIVIQPDGQVTIAEGADMTLALTQFVGAVEFLLKSSGLKGMLCSLPDDKQ